MWFQGRRDFGVHAGLSAVDREVDPVGGWRESDEFGPVDALGELPDGRLVEGAAGLRRVLREGHDLERALLRALLTWGLGRQLEPADEPTVERLLAALIAAETRGEAITLRALLEAIVTSEPFRKRRGERKR